MTLRELIGRVQSPNVRAVVEIAQAYSGLALLRYRSIRFPAGSCQLWEFAAHRNPRQPGAEPLGEAVVLAVFFRDKTIASWKRLDRGFDQAVAHYRHQAGLREHPAPAAPVRALPAPPPGVQVVLPPPRARRWTAGGEP